VNAQVEQRESASRAAGRRQHLGWAMDARRDETRARRMGEIVQVLAAGSRQGLQ
jgi:hypothetical protein